LQRFDYQITPTNLVSWRSPLFHVCCKLFRF